MVNNDLASCLQELQAHIIRWDAQPNAWSSIAIIEDSAVRREKQFCYLALSDLSSPENYANRFAQLMMHGYSWLNMNAAGIVDHTLIVVIELPNYVTTTIGKTSVNYSGAPIIYGQSKWDANDRIFLE
jgi:hypothetical protein